MHVTTMRVGDLHADLWGELEVTDRRVEGPEDVTVGLHPELGLCVISQWGGEDWIEWFTQRAISANSDSANSRNT